MKRKKKMMMMMMRKKGKNKRAFAQCYYRRDGRRGRGERTPVKSIKMNVEY